MSKTPRDPIGKDALERAALRYLERFAASAEQLRRVLERRVRRFAPEGDEAAAETARAVIADIIGRFVAAGVLDDRLYAEGKARSLLRTGRPVTVIGQRLAAKGVSSALVATVLEDMVAEVAAEGGDADLDAARAYARRRRLGPWRKDDGQREAMRERDLASLGRAGFSWRVALSVIDDGL